MWALSSAIPYCNKAIISSWAPTASYYFIKSSRWSGWIIMFIPAIAANLNSSASTQAMHNSFQVFGVFAFLADSIAF